MSDKPLDISGKELGLDEDYLEEKLEQLEDQTVSTSSETPEAEPGNEDQVADDGLSDDTDLEAQDLQTGDSADEGRQAEPFDLTGDGVAETYLGDDNADGVGDITYSDYDGDGYAETSLIDSEFDGSLDTIWVDLDGDLYGDITMSLEPIDLTGSTAYDTATYFEGGATDVITQDWVTTSDSVVFEWEYAEGPFDVPVDTAAPVETDLDWLTTGGTDDWSNWEASAQDDLSAWDTWSYGDTVSSDPLDSSGYYDTGTYDTGTYDTGSYDTGSYDTGTYDTGSWDSTALDNYAYTDSTYDSTEVWDDAYSYDSSDVWDSGTWDTSYDTGSDTGTEGYWMTEYDQADYDAYEAADDLSWDYWNASVDAYVAGDDEAANYYEDLSIESEGIANESWSDWMTGTDTWVDNSYDSYSYDTYDTYDSSYSYDSGYDTSYDTSYDTGDY